jgi:hypothetical protein
MAKRLPNKTPIGEPTACSVRNLNCFDWTRARRAINGSAVAQATGEVVARFLCCCCKKEPQATCALGVPKSEASIKQLRT